MRTRTSCLSSSVRLVTAVVLAPAVLALTLIGCGPRATTPLTMAAARGDVGDLERLIAAGADPNSGGDSAFTPLIWAARKGEVAAVRRLVALGADPNRSSGVNDWSPLLHALHKQQTKAALTLIELGAHITGRPGARALAMAVGYGNAEMTRALLARQVDPHVATGGGPSLLALAAAGAYDVDYRWSGCGSHTATVQALVDRAPDLRLNDTMWDRYAVVYVRRRRCADMLTLLEPRIAVKPAAAAP